LKEGIVNGFSGAVGKLKKYAVRTAAREAVSGNI
jgi:hypothetical protein